MNEGKGKMGVRNSLDPRTLGHVIRLKKGKGLKGLGTPFGTGLGSTTRAQRVLGTHLALGSC